MPTLAELAGDTSAMPSDIDGLSIVPTLLGQPTSRSSTTICTGRSTSAAAARPPASATGRRSSSRSIRRVRLYDLSKDIGEEHDVAAASPTSLPSSRPP